MSGGANRDVEVTEGDLFVPLMALSAPIIVSQLLQVAYNLADTFWVGRIGASAVSAISFAFPIVFLMISVGGGFAVAGTVLVSQHKGAENHEAVDHVAGQTIAFTALVSLALAAVGYVLSPWLITLIGATPGGHIHALAVEYTRTIFLGVIFMFGFFMFQSLLRGWGDTRTPMYLMAFGVALNVVLDPFFILGFQGNPVFGYVGLEGLQQTLYALTGFAGFGVQGAAVATILSRGVGAIVGIAYLFSGRLGIHLTLADLRLRLETVRTIVRIGAPASIDQGTRALGITALTAIVAFAGPDAVAAFGIGNRLNSLVFLPALGLAQGTATAVGQNLGADEVDRAKRAVFMSAGVIAAVLAAVSVVAYVFAPTFVGVFITGTGADRVVTIGTDFLRIIGPTFLFLGVFRVVAGAFQGSGSTRTAMGFTILSLWVLRLPPAYALVTHFEMGATGVWYAMAFSNVATAVVAALWFLRGTWTESVVDERGPSVAD
ncbi:MAG: MATE family efflux transporter [Halanaeroarchaeum sp.]